MVDASLTTDEWLAALAPGAPRRDEAIARLHALLLRAARFEAGRRRAALWDVDPAELDDLVNQAADDALVAVLAKLHTFRGQSRFETWAYKFALLEAGVKLRRRAWREREVALVADNDVDLRPSLEDGAETRERLDAIATVIEHELTPRQRSVLVAVTLDGVPIDVLAERMQTTRGALYKTLHDARQRLRARLKEKGL